jgi:hypothetical protein
MSDASHDCRRYPFSSCDWCKRAWLVYRWNKGTYNEHDDVIPLAELPVQVISNFLDYFDAITNQVVQEIRTEDDKEHLADLYVCAWLFLDELSRRNETHWLQHACGTWMPAC